jgi:glutamate racemase
MPAPTAPTTGRTIGVFDSGFGGLTVLRALLPRIPAAHYIYLGDTARLPYGAKSQATIARYAVESARFLAARGCEFLVIACNTATALALEDIRRAVSIPVLGVIEPGAHEAHRALTSVPSTSVCHPERSDSRLLRSAKSKDLPPGPQPQIADSFPPQALVLATTATVESHAYRTACDALGLRATEFPCPLLVPLVEEGWTGDQTGDQTDAQPRHRITRDVLRIYLSNALQLCSPQAVLLGCTHYPLLASAIESTLRQLGSQAIVVDSAEATAAAVAAMLMPSITTTDPPTPATFECFATDSAEKFKRLGSLFLQRPIPEVHHLDLGG